MRPRRRLRPTAKTALMYETEARLGEPLDRALRRLYYRENLSMEQVGQRIDASASTICRWLKALGIPLKVPAPPPGEDDGGDAA